MDDNEKYNPEKRLEYDLELCREKFKMYEEAICALERAIDEGEDGRFTPVAAKSIARQLGAYPTRIVLLKWKAPKEGEWSTHWQVFPPNRQSYYVHGHYFMNEKDARRDFEKREI